MITIFYPPTIPWKRLRQRPHQMLKYMARLGYRCVYHDPGTTGRAKPLIQIDTNLFLLSRDSSPDVVPRDGPRILWFTLPDHFRLVRDFYLEDLAIFDLCDEPSDEFSDWAKNLGKAFSASSCVITASALLFEKYKSSHPKVYFVPNGADCETFAKGSHDVEPPPDFPKRPGPVAGYHGVLSSWLDWNLIYHISRRLPEWNFVFVGPPVGVSYSQLPYGSNLFYLGEKNYEELPAYVSQFDVGTIPFQIRDMTRYSSPIKLYEYLSVGKPVVSTAIPEVASCPYAFVAEDSKEFASFLEKAMASNRESLKRERREWARRNSWEVRARQVDEIVKRLMVEGIG